MRDNDKKAIKPTNYYAVLGNTAHLDNENDHIMIGVKLRGNYREVTINAMIDSGATEDFIDEEFGDKYGLRTSRKKIPKEILLADGEISAMGPVTHTATVPMAIGSHREMISFEVANLPNHKVILGMPWLRNHNPRINWGQGKITFESDKCTEECLKESSSVYAILEDEAREENLHVEFGAIKSKKDLKIRVKQLDPRAKVHQQKFILRLRRGRHVRTHPTWFFSPLRPGRPDAIFKCRLRPDVTSDLNDVPLRPHTSCSSPAAHLTS